MNIEFHHPAWRRNLKFQFLMSFILLSLTGSELAHSYPLSITQLHEIKATAKEIEARCPQDSCYLVTVGRSPTPFNAYFQLTGSMNVKSLPLSNFRYEVHDHQDLPPVLKAKLFRHFDRFLPTASELGERRILFLDFGVSGCSFLSFQKFIRHYRKSRGIRAEFQGILLRSPSKKQDETTPGIEELPIYGELAVALERSTYETVSLYPRFDVKRDNSKELQENPSYTQLLREMASALEVDALLEEQNSQEIESPVEKTAAENCLRRQEQTKLAEKTSLADYGYPAEHMSCLVDSFDSLETQNEVKSLVTTLSLSHRKKLVVSYIEYFYDHIEDFTDANREKLFNSYTKITHQVLPEVGIHQYFFDFGNHLANAPTLEGLKVVLNHFKNKEKDSEKYKNKLNNVAFTFLAEFTERLNELAAQNFVGDRQFLVLAAGTVGGHYIPVLLKKTETDTTFIITDSGPWLLPDHKTGKTTTNRYVAAIQRVIGLSNLKNVNLFAFLYGRQADGVSCSITSFRDILEAQKIDLFDYIKNVDPSRIEKINGTNLSIVAYYPPHFMKVAQRLAYIDDYEKQNPDARTTIVAVKTVLKNGESVIEKKTLRQVIEAHTLSVLVNNRVEKRNFYLRKKGFKYFRLIIRSVVEKIDENASPTVRY